MPMIWPLDAEEPDTAALDEGMETEIDMLREENSLLRAMVRKGSRRGAPRSVDASSGSGETERSDALSDFRACLREGEGMLAQLTSSHSSGGSSVGVCGEHGLLPPLGPNLTSTQFDDIMSLTAFIKV